MQHPFIRGALALFTALVLTACGGGDGGTSPPPPARGTLLQGMQVAATVARASIDAATGAQGITALTGAATCDVEVRYVRYVTRDPLGKPATASAGVLVPTGAAPACSGQRPVVLYAHGTSTDKAFNMAQVGSNGEAALVMAFYAAQGFIVVAPNYLGYDSSDLSYTPYLNAEASAVDMVDGLRAAKTYLAGVGTTRPSSRLLITGYSQGGHVAMATQKVMERDHRFEFSVTASGPMSGPYNLVQMGDVVTAGTINAGATIFLPLQLTSYQKSYGNIYGSPSEVYQSPYDLSSETLFPSTKSLTQLVMEGKLPNDGGTFTQVFGVGGLLTDAFRATYATSNFRRALQTNTLLGWNPSAPLAMCGGANDPTVFFFNTTDAQADFFSRGKTVPAFNLESRVSLPAGAAGDAVYNGFQLAKTNAGAGATAAYHGTLVPPFCNVLVRSFFLTVLAAI